MRRKEDARYDSLLLRIWRRGGPDAPEWSGRVEHVQAGIALRFSEPEALIAYLWAVIGTYESIMPAPAPLRGNADPSSGNEMFGATELPGSGEDA